MASVVQAGSILVPLAIDTRLELLILGNAVCLEIVANSSQA
jgi:hypothetical protein